MKEFSADIANFLKDFLPSSNSCPLGTSPSEFFPLVSSHEKDSEKDYRDCIYEGLTKLSKNYMNDKPLHFTDTHLQPRLRPAQSESTPHIVAHVEDSSKSAPNSWATAVFAVQTRKLQSDDPVSNTSNSDRHRQSRTELCNYAQSLLVARSALFCFVLGFYGDCARIFRFDRTGAIASPAFDHRTTPAIVGDFMWRLVHPVDSVLAFVGADPYVARPTSGDVRRYQQVAGSEDQDRHVINVPSRSGRPMMFLISRTVTLEHDLFSCGTHIRQVVQKDGTRAMLKDTWRNGDAVPETVFYAHLGNVLAEERIGVAKMVCGADLGDIERQTLGRNKNLRSNVPRTATLRTISVTHGQDTPDIEHLERSLMRLVVDWVGRPVCEFTSTREAVVALRDAVTGHQQAYNAGVLHRDISDSNIMIVASTNEPSGSKGSKKPILKIKSGGFLVNFDKSSFIEDMNGKFPQPPKKSDLAKYFARNHPQHNVHNLKGTLPFVAIAMLEQAAETAPVHTVLHDLESFFWVLVFLVLRHMDHLHPQGAHAYRQLFDHASEAEHRRAKIDWLSETPVKVRNNGPLTRLLAQLTKRVAASHGIGLGNTNGRDAVEDRQPLDYLSFVGEFDAALFKRGWPHGDAALPFGTDSREAAASQGTDAPVVPRQSIPSRAEPSRPGPAEAGPSRLDGSGPVAVQASPSQRPGDANILQDSDADNLPAGIALASEAPRNLRKRSRAPEESSVSKPQPRAKRRRR